MNFTYVRCLTSALAALAVSIVAVGAPVCPARATDDFADAATSKIAYRTPLLASHYACASLAGRALNTTTHVTSATLVAATENVPAYCDVQGVVAPSILFDVALPVAWNERLYGLGNSGCGDVLADNFADRNIGLANGFAVVSTNTGMEDTSGDCSWAAGNPNLVTDFAYNGIHSAATTAKLLLQIYYAHAPIASYYNSCSDGGHDGLEEAERFPTDYNGIVAGAPLLGAGTIYSLAWTSTTYAALPASQAMTSAQLAYITAVINLKCDALDGLDDGIVSDPQDCAKAFVPTRDLRVCTAGLNPNSCLTAAQLSAYIKATGPVMSNGVAIYPGQALGSEANLLTVQIPAPGQPLNQASSYFYADTAMEYLFPWPNTNTTAYRAATFNYNTAPAKLMTFRTMFDAMSLDLDPFFNAGGRLLVYHGLADPLITPYGTIAYFEDGLAIGGSALQSYVHFYPVPGMSHCSGGSGADQFDPMTPIINWIEAGTQPTTILSRHFTGSTITFTRTLCPYPSISHYIHGSASQASSFGCIAGPTGVPGTGTGDGLQTP